MTASILADEHVPSVFLTELASSGYEVYSAKDVLGEGTPDRELLLYCRRNGHLLLTHDKEDFGGRIGEDVEHPGILIYTDSTLLRTEPSGSVVLLDRILELYPSEELQGNRVWLDQWR